MDTLTFRNPRLVGLALLVIVAAGLSAFLSLGRQEDPTITNINAVVTTAWPGADPGRVEALVTRKIEEELRTIPEIDVIESTSTTGISVVSVELIETVDPAAIPEIWTKARDRVADAALPAGAAEPDFDSDSLGAYAAILAIVPTGEDWQPAIAARHAEALEERLRNLPGADHVETFGLPREEVTVRLDMDRAAALGLTPDAVAAAIAAGDAKGQSGRVTADGADILIDVEGDISALTRVRGIVLRDGGQGSAVHVGDIAEVTRGPRTPESSLAFVDGTPAMLVAVQTADGLQVDRWMTGLRAEAGAFAETLPASLRLVQTFDQAGYTVDRLTEVALNMALGMGLVIAVLFLTLGARPALIVAGVLPLVSLATLATMNLIGLPLHQMSVTGLIVALGLLVDAAIVMTDEIRQRLGAGLSRVAAVSGAVRRLAVPLLASTVTTALSFVPMILLPGPAGDFVGAIAIAVVLMLFWSLVVALTITPAIAGWTLARSGAPGLPGGALARAFRRTLAASLRHPVRSVALALVLPVTGFLALPTLTAQFFPGVERDQFHIEVEARAGTGIHATAQLARQIGARLAADDRIEEVTWVVGESAPAFYYNIVGSRSNEPGYTQALVTTTSAEATDAILAPLQEELTGDFPEARILVRGLVQGPPVDAPVELRLVGQDLAALRRTGEEIRRTLLGLDPVTAVRTDLEGGAPKVAVDVDEGAAQLLGLTLGDVSRQLQAGLEGATGGSLVEGTEELPVRVRLGDDIRGDLDRIAQLPILPPDAPARAARGEATQAPLSALAELSLVPSDSAISRRNGERVNTVQAFLAPDVLPQEALGQAQAALDAAGFTLPEGMRLEIGGDSDARTETVRNLMSSLGLIVTLSIATIVLTFNSVRLSAITFVVAGLSAGLSILSLAVFNYPFGINAIIGVIGSIGVSINAAIIILSGLQEDEGAMAGDRDAMAEVVMSSSRHILSTTLTTFGGFLPLILEGGGFWPPFAMSVAGGVLLSTVVSFYFTPQMFALLRPRRRRAPAPALAHPPVLRVAAE